MGGGWARRSQAEKKLKKKLTGACSLVLWDFITTNRKDNMSKETMSTEEAKGKTLKKEYQRGGSKRQHILDKAVEYLKAPIRETQGDRHHFCLTNLMMNETEYLEALNKATNGGLVEAAWN